MHTYTNKTAAEEILRGDTLLTTQAIMNRFQVSRITIWRWQKSGMLKGVQLPGGGWRYRVADVAAFERSRWG